MSEEGRRETNDGEGTPAADPVGDDASSTAENSPATYGGVPGAFPYALRASDSWLFRSYVVLGGLLALLVAVVFALGTVYVVGRTIGAAGGTFSFSRAFVVFVGFVVVAPLLAPVLFVARRHRREGSTRRYDATVAAAGYCFVASLYVGLVSLTPPEQREAVNGALAPVVEALYVLPAWAGAVPPVVGALAIWLAARR